MKLVYAVSESTKSKWPAARHIDNGQRKPLCGGNGRNPFFWAPAQGEPASRICLRLSTGIQTEQIAQTKERD